MAATGNWIAQVCNTSGTGSLVLGDTVNSSYVAFVDVIPAGLVYYAIENGDNRETGVGTFDGVSVIERTKINATKVGTVYSEDGTPINLSGSSVVSCTVNAKTTRDIFDAIENKTFISLSDVNETTYTDKASRPVGVNVTANGLVFLDGMTDTATGPVLALSNSLIATAVDLEVSGKGSFNQSNSTSVLSHSGVFENSFPSNASLVSLGFNNRRDVGSAGIKGAIVYDGANKSSGQGNFVFCLNNSADINVPASLSDGKVWITPDGFVGIGLPDPLAPLHIVHADDVGIRIGPSFVGSYNLGRSPDGYFIIKSNQAGFSGLKIQDSTGIDMFVFERDGVGGSFRPGSHIYLKTGRFLFSGDSSQLNFGHDGTNGNINNSLGTLFLRSQVNGGVVNIQTRDSAGVEKNGINVGGGSPNCIFYGDGAVSFSTKASPTLRTINFPAMPTSSAGLVAGDLWRNGNTVNIV